jgi:hypothetical protein
MPSRQEAEQQILDLLPADGSPVLNRVMMTLIARRLGAHVDFDTYFAAIDTLSVAGTIGRQRGQGGKIYRLDPAPAAGETQAVDWPEPKLMPNLARYLRTVFWRTLDLPSDRLWNVIDTSMHGPQEKWGRPDFTVVCIMPLRVLPTPQLDVYAFELKAEPAADLTSVHQVFAQTRMTHFGYLVWHLPDGSPYETRKPDITEQCHRLGIGLILIRDPDLLETWQIEVDATRQGTTPSEIDSFLAARLPEADCAQIRRRLSGS